MNKLETDEQVPAVSTSAVLVGSLIVCACIVLGGLTLLCNWIVRGN